MSKKTKQILAGIVALILVFAAYFGWRNMQQDHGRKAIHLEIIAEDTVIFDETVNTETGTLADLLREMESAGTIQLAYSQSSYGMYIQGMGLDTLYEEDPAKGLYWTYTSDNNAQCLQNNFCDAADSLMIEDGDHFVFTLTRFES